MSTPIDSRVRPFPYFRRRFTVASSDRSFHKVEERKEDSETRKMAKI
ncbi:hypothetical protein [Methanosarcina lacustris]|nr:hypothetical protein [Methanosarcina lacustris]